MKAVKIGCLMFGLSTVALATGTGNNAVPATTPAPMPNTAAPAAPAPEMKQEGQKPGETAATHKSHNNKSKKHKKAADKK